MSAADQQVIPHGSGWAVRRTGSRRVSGHFDTQREAIARARAIAKKQGGYVYLFGADGRLRQRVAPAGETGTS